jgi:hypothetical protein
VQSKPSTGEVQDAEALQTSTALLRFVEIDQPILVAPEDMENRPDLARAQVVRQFDDEAVFAPELASHRDKMLPNAALHVHSCVSIAVVGRAVQQLELLCK